jgi:hypothetical protein
MNKELLFPLIRHGLTVGAGYLVAKGALDEGSANEVVGAVMALAGVGWSLLEKRLSRKEAP